MFPLGRRLALGCVAVVVALTGCGGGGSKPVSLPSISPSSSPTVSPTSTPDSGRAAVAVVRSYYRVVNDLHLHMDAAALGSLMVRYCTCQQQVRAVKAAAAKGEKYIDSAHLVSLTPAVNSATSVDVLVEYNAGPGGLVDAKGRHVTSAPPKKGLKRLFHVRLVGSAWLIVEIDDA